MRRAERPKPLGVCSVCYALTNLHEDVYRPCDQIVNGKRCDGTFQNAVTYLWERCPSYKATGEIGIQVCGECSGFGWYDVRLTSSTGRVSSFGEHIDFQSQIWITPDDSSGQRGAKIKTSGTNLCRLELKEIKMSKIKESIIHKVHPTQLTVGMIEVQDKKKHLASLKPQEQRDFMQAHPMPAVTGPEGKVYITDHHHLGRAAIEAGVTTGFLLVEADLSSCNLADFWTEMDRNQWVHPLDENGVRHDYNAIPHKLEMLVDDAYRSLAGYVRNAGGYDKTPTAFAEFLWADFFRRSVPIEVVKADFQAAFQTALPLAKSDLAKGMPGFKEK